jgi:hypothetical protein
MKIQNLTDPMPILVANAIKINSSNWKWDFIENNILNKTRNFVCACFDCLDSLGLRGNYFSDL